MVSATFSDTTFSDRAADEPVTLHRIMQTMIGEGLRERYEAPQKLSHELFVLLMQMKEQERPARAAPKRKAKTTPAALPVLDAVAK